jgi:hypothetical protein
MIDSLFNLVFRCRHGHLSQPTRALNQALRPAGDCYVVCLDCGKRFGYDLNEFRMGKQIPAEQRLSA